MYTILLIGFGRICPSLHTAPLPPHHPPTSQMEEDDAQCEVEAERHASKIREFERQRSDIHRALLPLRRRGTAGVGSEGVPSPSTDGGASVRAEGSAIGGSASSEAAGSAQLSLREREQESSLARKEELLAAREEDEQQEHTSRVASLAESREAMQRRIASRERSARELWAARHERIFHDLESQISARKRDAALQAAAVAGPPSAQGSVLSIAGTAPTRPTDSSLFDASNGSAAAAITTGNAGLALLAPAAPSAHSGMHAQGLVAEDSLAPLPPDHPAHKFYSATSGVSAQSSIGRGQSSVGRTVQGGLQGAGGRPLLGTFPGGLFSAGAAASVVAGSPLSPASAAPGSAAAAFSRATSGMSLPNPAPPAGPSGWAPFGDVQAAPPATSSEAGGNAPG